MSEERKILIEYCVTFGVPFVDNKQTERNYQDECFPDDSNGRAGYYFFSVFLLRFLFLRPEDSEVQEGGVEMEFLT